MNKGKIKIGVYMCAILMMGVIAVSSNLTNIMAAFPDVNPNTVVSSMISASCFAIIIMSLVTGKLMDFVSKKVLMIVGILLWLIGGVVPFFLSSLTAMMVMRLVFGVGCGMVMSTCPAILAEHIEDPVERGKATGTMTAFQMLGCVFFSIVAGNLAKLGWKVPFLVHLMAIVSLIFCLTCIPNTKPVRAAAEKVKFKPTGMMWVWAISFLIFMLAGQEYSNACSTLIAEAGLGDAAAAGYSLALFAAGGVVCGFIFGALAKAFKRFTLTVGCFVLAISYLVMTFASQSGNGVDRRVYLRYRILYLYALHYHWCWQFCGRSFFWYGDLHRYLRSESGADPVLLCGSPFGGGMGRFRRRPDSKPVWHDCRRNYRRSLWYHLHLPE